MICGGEPGGEMTLQCEWEEKRVAEDMKRLSGEPYQVYTYGVGWHDADKPGHPPAVRLPTVQAEADGACCRDTPTRRPWPCGSDSCG